MGTLLLVVLAASFTGFITSAILLYKLLKSKNRTIS